MSTVELTWDEVADAAEAISWICYVGTVGRHGRPHVAVVAPGLAEEGTIWFATRRDTQKHRNLLTNEDVSFHWPVTTGSGPGELFARGIATIHDSPKARTRRWNRVVPYDMTNFWGSADNEALILVETRVTRASLMGPEFTRSVWLPHST